MVLVAAAEEATTRPHMTLPVLGASGTQLGQNGQVVSPLIMVPRSMSPPVRVVTEPLPDIVVLTVLLGMHGSRGTASRQYSRPAALPRSTDEANMVSLDINTLAGFSPALDALTDRQRAALVEVVFCYRLDVLSATAVFNDADVLREVAGQIPDEVARAKTRRYGVDLESISAGQPRFYVDGDVPETVLLGFTYSAPGMLAEWKLYRRDRNDKQSVLIDRYDAEDRLISVGEVERAGGPELWKGPRSLPQKATAAGMHPIILAKEAKDQSYLRLLPS